MGKRAASGDGAPAEPAAQATAKKKARAKGAPKKSPDKPAAAAAEAPIIIMDDTNVCAKILGEVHDAVNTILAHDVFKNIVEAPPLSICEGGLQSAFNDEECQSVLKASPQDPKKGDGHAYQRGGNFMWQSFTWMANHRVPINMGQIKDQWAPSLRHD